MKPNASPALPDSDPSAERALLGGCLYGISETQEVLDEIAEVVPNESERSELFADPFCILLYQALVRLDHQGAAISINSVEQECRRLLFLTGRARPGELANIATNLHQVLNDAAPPSLASTYAERLHALYIYRKLRLATASASITVQQTPPTTTKHDAESLIERVENAVLEVRDRCETASRTETASQIAVELSEKLEHELHHQAPRGLVRTGFEPMDRALHLAESRVVVLAGRPGSGKSALAGFLACRAALNGTPVLYFSIEMSRTDVAQRMVAGMAGIPWAVSPSQTVMSRYADEIARFANLPLWIDDSYNLTINTIAARVRRLKRRHNLRFVVVDYLQLVRVTGKFHSRENEVAAISRAMKVIAGENQIVLLLLSQLNRDPDKNRSQTRAPRMSDLRESGAIEQDADVVALLHQPTEDVVDPRHVPLHVIVDKNRTGMTGITRLTFHKETSAFELRTEPDDAPVLQITEPDASNAEQLPIPITP